MDDYEIGSTGGEKIDINGIKVTKKLFNRESLRHCSVCGSYPKKSMDEMVGGSELQKMRMNLIITEIDLSKGKAKMVGINDTVDVQVMRNEMGLIFIEISHSAIHTYVVYDTKTKEATVDTSTFPPSWKQFETLFGLGVYTI